MRAPGMTLGRMPMFVWTMLTVSAMTLLILPPLSAAQIMLLLDRFLGAHYFDTQAGGSAIIWQTFVKRKEEMLSASNNKMHSLIKSSPKKKSGFARHRSTPYPQRRTCPCLEASA